MAEMLKEQLEGYLATNNSWMLGCPGIPGKDWWDCMAAWKVQKTIILRRMVKDLEELEAKDNELSTLVRSIIAREVAVQNWQASCGVFPIWNGMFSKAKGKAKKNLTGVTPLDELNKGIFKHDQKDPRRAAKFGLPGAAARPGSRASGPGRNDALNGRR